MDIWTLHDELSLAKPSFKWLSPDYIKLGLSCGIKYGSQTLRETTYL